MMSVANEKLKPNQYTRLHANSIEPVVQAVRKIAARQVIKNGESGKLQDLVNYVMLALTQEKHKALVDQLYAEGKEAFDYAVEHGHLKPGFAAEILV
jgi:hypothetical protein